MRDGGAGCKTKRGGGISCLQFVVFSGIWDKRGGRGEWEVGGEGEGEEREKKKRAGEGGEKERRERKGEGR